MPVVNCTIPFGYDYDKETRTFSINEAEAAVINLIYDTYEDTRSMLYVARTLNEKGIRPRRTAFRGHPTTVSTILKNPFYTGAYRYNYHDETASDGNTSGKHLKDKSEWVFVENHHPGNHTSRASGSRHRNAGAQPSNQQALLQNVHSEEHPHLCRASVLPLLWQADAKHR